jgi:hypothetical protein
MSLSNARITPLSAARELYRAYQRGIFSGGELLRTISVSDREKEILFETAGVAGRAQAEAHLQHRRAIRTAFLSLIARSQIRTGRSTRKKHLRRGSR